MPSVKASRQNSVLSYCALYIHFCKTARDTANIPMHEEKKTERRGAWLKKILSKKKKILLNAGFFIFLLSDEQYSGVL